MSPQWKKFSALLGCQTVKDATSDKFIRWREPKPASPDTSAKKGSGTPRKTGTSTPKKNAKDSSDDPDKDAPNVVRLPRVKSGLCLPPRHEDPRDPTAAELQESEDESDNETAEVIKPACILGATGEDEEGDLLGG